MNSCGSRQIRNRFCNVHIATLISLQSDVLCTELEKHFYRIDFHGPFPTQLMQSKYEIEVDNENVKSTNLYRTA